MTWLKKTRWLFVVIALLLVLFFKMPVNRFIPQQTGNVNLSIVETITLSSGKLYFQIKGEPLVWRLDYNICGVTSWCIDLLSGENQLNARVSPAQGGVKLSNVTFNGDNQLLNHVVPTTMATYALEASADSVFIADVECPADDLDVVGASARVLNIDVLGYSMDDIIIDVVTNKQDANKNTLSVNVDGAVQGALNVSSSDYSGRFKMSQIPPALQTMLSSQQLLSGLSVDGKLPCSNSRKS